MRTGPAAPSGASRPSSPTTCSARDRPLVSSPWWRVPARAPSLNMQIVFSYVGPCQADAVRTSGRDGRSAHECAERLEVTAHAVAGELSISRLDGGGDALVRPEHLGRDLVAGLRCQALDLVQAA